jgi:hypothetical protein
MSGQLPWLNEGAELSLVLSPVNTNIGCSIVLIEVLLDAAELAGRSKVHGTGTSFSPVVVVLAPVLDVDGVVLPLIAEELNWITAKSILPESGLMITSLMVPSWSPDVVCTCAPVSLVARMSWCCRPVALML